MATSFTDKADLPGHLALAEQEIYATYGDRVSVWEKRKTLIKFGRNRDLDANVQETIWSLGGHETYVNDNLITSVSSSSGSDTQTVRVEGHTVSGTGTDQQFTFVTQDVVLTGQTDATLTTPLARVSRLVNLGSTELVGDVYVHEGGATTAGVPNDLATAHLLVAGSVGENQSRKAATTFSNTDYFICTEFTGGVQRTTAAAVDFIFEVRPPGLIFAPKAQWTADQGGTVINMDPYLLVPKNNDCRIAGTTNTNNTVAIAQFSGYLAKVIQ